MYRAVLIAQVLLGVAKAVPVEWKGIFYTPEALYKWGAQKVLKQENQWDYADATMKMAAIPTSGATAQDLALADSAGTTALALACEEVSHLGRITPAENKCYTLKFNTLQEQTLFDVDATLAGSIAFFLQHMPWEFETTEHYLKDITGVDIEPQTQIPEPDSAGSSDGHDHSHGVTDVWVDPYLRYCVCQAQANNWQLDCNNMAKINEAVTNLEANPACAGISPPVTCIDNFYILQAHHDHCLHNQLPTGAEMYLHKYEQFFTDCMVKRQFDTTLAAGACAAVNCTDATSLTNAVQNLQTGNCNGTQLCAAGVCSAAMKTVLMAHDTCPENLLPNNLEVALHNYEDACAAELCNSVPAVFDPYAQACNASAATPAPTPVSSDGFGLQDSFFLVAWVLPVFILTQ